MDSNGRVDITLTEQKVTTVMEMDCKLVPNSTDDYEMFLAGCFDIKLDPSDGNGLRRTGWPSPLKLGEMTPAGHSAFRLIRLAQEELTDTEMLEMVLCSIIPHQRLASVTRVLLRRFNNFSGVICASLDDLSEIEGLGEGGVATIKTIQAAAVRLARAEIVDRPIIDNWSRLIDYLTVAISRETTEHLRLLYLDSQNRLIGDELHCKGTVNMVPLQTRELLHRVLRMNATAVILVHNHPSGSPKPSQADIELTKVVSRILQLISVTLHDHVVIGKEGWFSFRKECLI
jgi:DNA repair protein RadC